MRAAGQENLPNLLRGWNDRLDAELRSESGHYGTVGDQLSVVGDDVWDTPACSQP